MFKYPVTTEVNDRRCERDTSTRWWEQPIFKWKGHFFFLTAFPTPPSLFYLFFFFFSKRDWVFFKYSKLSYPTFQLIVPFFSLPNPPVCSDEKFNELPAIFQHHSCSTKHPEPHMIPAATSTIQIYRYMCATCTLLHPFLLLEDTNLFWGQICICSNFSKT